MSKNGDVPQETIARALGITRERVGQIERAAFAKIRRLVLETDEYPLLREELSIQVAPEKESVIRARRAVNDRRARDRVAARDRRAAAASVRDEQRQGPTSGPRSGEKRGGSLEREDRGRVRREERDV